MKITELHDKWVIWAYLKVPIQMYGLILLATKYGATIAIRGEAR